MRISDCAGLSDVGSVRPNNEDRWFADPGRGFFIVADGLGGHAAGEVAAQRVVEGFPRLLGTRLETLAVQPDPRVARTLAAAIRGVNSEIRKEGQTNADCRGMGATVVIALVLGEAAFVANVGDCRAYLFRSGKLHLLTRDHSLAQYLLDQGAMASDDPRMAYARQQLLQHMGIPEQPVPWMCKVALAGDDRMLLCSDGLTDMLRENEISDVLRRETTAHAACTALVNMANLAGGRDNITVVVVKIDG